MPLLHPVPYLGLVFKYNYLIALAIFHSFSGDFSTFHYRCTGAYLIAVSDQQHPVQLNLAAVFYFQTLDINGLSLGDFILLAAGFNNRVNFRPPKIIF